MTEREGRKLEASRASSWRVEEGGEGLDGSGRRGMLPALAPGRRRQGEGQVGWAGSASWARGHWVGLGFLFLFSSISFFVILFALPNKLAKHFH